MRRRLAFFAQHWNLSQPVLACKYCGLPTGAVVGPGVYPKGLPSAFAVAGVTRLLPAVVIVWRPLCMHRLSRHSHAAALVKHLASASAGSAPALRFAAGLPKVRKTFLAEIAWLEGFVTAANASRHGSGPPTAAVSLATLVWEPHRVAAQLNTFLPQLQIPRSGTVPPPGPEDKFVASFGALNPPEAVGYSRRTELCTWSGPEYVVLGKDERQRLKMAHEYLSEEYLRHAAEPTHVHPAAWRARG